MAKGQAKIGRPPKDLDWKAFEASCRCWCTQEEICSIFDVTVKTLDQACIRHYGVRFSRIYTEKANGGKRCLRRAQLRTALKGNPAMLIWLGKQKLDQKDTVVTAVHFDPNKQVQWFDDENHGTAESPEPGPSDITR